MANTSSLKGSPASDLLLLRGDPTDARGWRACLSKHGSLGISFNVAGSRSGLVLATALVVLSSLDVLTTHLGLQLGAVEANPFFASLLAGVGPTAAYVTKLVAVSIVAALAYRSGRLRLLRWLSLAMVCIVICNVVVLS